MHSFTQAQKDAIAARGNVLVVAGAGTGKTHTLVERCLALLLDPQQPCSIENILMVTFTEAAAAEMRHRIRLALLQRQAAQPDNDHLARQLALLDTAHISTLHGFCLHLVRQHFHELGLDPQLTVLDELQTQPLIQETFTALFARHYAAKTPAAEAVRQLIRREGRGSEERIRALVLRVHRYTQTLPSPAKWFERQLALFAEEEPRQWREWFAEGFQVWSESWRAVLQPMASQAENLERCVRALERTFSGETAMEGMAEAIGEILAADAADWPKRRKTELRDPIKKFFEEAAFLASITRRTGVAPVSDQTQTAGETAGEDGERRDACPTDPLTEDWQWVRPPMTALLQLAQEFGEEFARAKRELGGLDFSDLEQFALQLLWEADPDQGTAIARQWQQRFQHVFVDEYQDINEAQDRVIAALSRAGERANRFLVGDVKQSIYRFRLAKPSIFRDYERAWGADPALGRRLPLADNFRSREAILAFVNSLFAALMRDPVGGVAYDDDARLRFGDREGRRALAREADAARTPLARVEFHLLVKPSENGNGAAGEDGSSAEAELLDLQATEREARLVAARLRELRSERHAIFDAKAGAFRPVTWSDMVVLLRSPAGRVESFAKEFSKLGVPLQAARGGFYESAEILDLLSLLQLLDNPLQDVPLLAVLRSPLAGWSLDELVETRLALKPGLFWTALNRIADCGLRISDLPHSAPEPNRQSAIGNRQLPAKAALFLTQFARWRRLAREGSLSACLEAALAETHYEALLRAGPRGEERVANVRRFLKLARQFDPYQRQGLYRFLRFIETQQEAGLEEEPAPLPTRDAVRLMSIHKSKGLEFPVVAVAGLGTRFNLQDLHGDLLLNEYYGLCPKVLPPEADERYPSLPHWLAAQRERRELLGEELRLLYVAMTRARDTLVLVGTAPSERAGEPWASALPAGDRPARPTDREIIEARRPLDWLRLWLPSVTRDGDWHSPERGQNDLLRWTLWPASDPRLQALKQDEAAPAATGVSEPDAAAVHQLRERILWSYPFVAATVEPAKTTVTVLRRRAATEEEEEARGLFQFEAQSPKFKVARRSGAPSGLSATERGTAHHLFMECVALDRVGSTAELRNEAARLVEAGVLAADQATALDFDALRFFWQSELGRRIGAQPSSAVHREIPFTARVTPRELAELGIALGPAEAEATLQGEFLVMQGTVDLALLLPDGIVLVDFKTDQFKPAELAEKVKLYVPQLKLYALALGRIYRRPVNERWLHFLELGRSVAV
ncbi:MAG: helicase-exonuclease AddAB subunit AddA [Verrucomicrobia bacterium]|nr:helicase-exonuclease AddAB subunit AddA [Verrucomicrobiota bacterium]